MCEFSHENSVLVDIPENEALLGHRFWEIRGNNLFSIYQDSVFKSKKVCFPSKCKNNSFSIWRINSK